MATTTTAISLDETLLARMNERASELKLPLSRLLALAAEEFLNSHASRMATPLQGTQRATYLRAINEAWSDGLDAEERAVLRGMQKKYRAAAKDPW